MGKAYGNKCVATISLICLCLSLCGCASKEDKQLAQDVYESIEHINTITLDCAKEIYDIQLAYENLTAKQKKLVKNSNKLNDAVSELEELIVQQEIEKDPTNTITKGELVGIWKQSTTDSLKGYFYFTQQGYIYYLATGNANLVIDQSSFSAEYIVATSFSLGNYNRSSHAKDGSFYNTATKKDAKFAVTKSQSGQLTMDMTCGAASGSYTKTGIKIERKSRSGKPTSSRAVSARIAKGILPMRKCRATISSLGVKAGIRLPTTAKCAVRTATAVRAMYKRIPPEIRRGFQLVP